MFGDKKNSENLFIERWYQLLRANGRLAAVLPESVFDTSENKYIRLFIYKYFKVKAVVSLPQLAFEPFTSTKTSILFAQKKTQAEIEQWNKVWADVSKQYSQLKTRTENIIDVVDGKKAKTKLPSIRNLTEKEESDVIKTMLQSYLSPADKDKSAVELVTKYRSELAMITKLDKDLQDYFGYVNVWWVFSEVAKQLSYDIFMAEVDSIGYKRTKRGEKKTSNDLCRIDGSENIIVDDGKLDTVLDYMRNLGWE